MRNTSGVRIAGLAVRWHTLPAPADRGDAPAAFGLWVLADPDATIDAMTQEEFERTDERMPYFAMVWASADSLVSRVLEGPRLDGLQVLDLGCGLGPCGFAAAHLGAHVTFFDWEPRALEIAQHSAARQPVPLSRFEFLVGDWRNPPPMGPFDLILGADVLYEQRNAPAVAAFLASHLKPDAEAWIGDPGRPQAGPFPALAERHGLQVVSSEIMPPRAHQAEITLLRVRRPTS
ncbi:MAG: class I SAM-dependent methyltransferase [Chloroflexi bacterium]|nr:class I SAM-dependent methyltransferase [Chloroflexota bacterium]